MNEIFLVFFTSIVNPHDFFFITYCCCSSAVVEKSCSVCWPDDICSKALFGISLAKQGQSVVPTYVPTTLSANTLVVVVVAR